MNKVVVTTEIDVGLNEALEEIARFDNRSASDLADQAIRNLVAERVATRELLHHGLRLIDGDDVKAVDSAEIHDWLLSDRDAFPQGNAPFCHAQPHPPSPPVQTPPFALTSP